jgi:Holliday junction resolvase
MPVAGALVFENILARAFRKAGWRVHRRPAAGDMEADLIVDDGEKKYVIELKGASEGRRDRLIPLLSQAILQVRAFAHRLAGSAAPLAVVAARRIPASVAEHITRFAERHAPDVAVGVIDAEGFRSFVGPGLEKLNAAPPRRRTGLVASSQRKPDLFSGLNQWMLKILLGQRLPERLISVPREPIRNASQLAKVANVSVMSASRLVNQLANQGFLDRSEDTIRVVRVDELLDRWASANRELSLDIPARWLIKKDDKRFQLFFAAVTEYEAHRKSLEGRTHSALPRCCAGLFAAADALGLGFVEGVPPHLYLEHMDFDALQKLGLSTEVSTLQPDVYIRIPSNKEAIFDAEVWDAEVWRAAIPLTDALQVWLDVSVYPARGKAQADQIWRRVLKPTFEKQR